MFGRGKTLSRGLYAEGPQEMKAAVKRITFFSELDLGSILYVFIFRHRYNEVYYFDITLFAIVAVRLLEAGRYIKYLDLKFSRMRNERDENFASKVLSRDMTDICDMI